MKKTFLLFFAFAILLVADEAHEIMQKVDNNIRGKNIYMKINMKVVSLLHERNMQMETWSQGSKKSFVKVLYPPKDKGITFLSLDNQMWQYVPKIERTIKIPPSMMLQKWMGSDITNDDMVKQSSIVDDYNPKIIKKDGNIVTMELIPKEDAAVVWGKIVSQIDTSTYTSKKDIFYDENIEEVRVFIYKDIKKYGEYYLPTYWRVQSVDKTDNYTEITLDNVKYDMDISEQYFKKSALKRFSR
ncbi:outer membrane lipoprotein-sorting protein [Candidatus Sulfurimonas baltica]|uniref:Outer membrane lipoprotein-sorting protein n=1 Tax=Candidatus Sulfurimonas baltica TaxID=2740404 RepID=A0A7S7RLQ9_9BACT|nr:outer membrane lipoprotein-sorting protein [Candidatus Sulfurimonas baltica]QOY51387.1 outer membrane lipoprotein-sorting protein [Candidatus Sulfurimonas baltica]